MKRKKLFLALIVICGLLLGLGVLREVGVVDAAWYKSKMSTSQFTSKAQSGPKELSYRLTIKHRDETLQNLSHSSNGRPPIDIEATLDEPVYSGNAGMPLVKNFKMKYQCTFKTPNPVDQQDVSGKIEGEVTAAIHGLCSRRKARELAFAEAKKQIMEYFQKQLPK